MRCDLNDLEKTLCGADSFRDCTGDACIGDEVIFNEGVFGGSFRSPKFLGNRAIRARIVKDSYGETRGQHTFTLEIVAASGYDSGELAPGSRIRRKGRNVYRNGTARRAWDDESKRGAALDEKHHRGDCARAKKEIARAF